MARIHIPSRDETPDASKPILEAVNKQLGVVPNLYRLIGGSPAALAGFAGLQGALSKTLDLKTRERIALAVAQVNGCDYCLSAHTYLGLNLAKISAEEITLNRRGASSDPKAHAARAVRRDGCARPRPRQRRRHTGRARRRFHGRAGRGDYRARRREQLHELS